MRSLKKAAALLLTLAMLMGMVAVLLVAFRADPGLRFPFAIIAKGRIPQSAPCCNAVKNAMTAVARAGAMAPRPIMERLQAASALGTNAGAL